MNKSISMLLIFAMVSHTVPAMAQTPTNEPPKISAEREVTTPAPDGRLAEIRDWLAMPPEKLAALAQETGFQALAELRAGLRIGQLETRQKNLEQFRIDLLAQAEAADQRRAQLLKRIEDEVEQIRQQFGDDQGECANQIRIVIHQHRDAVLTLKAAADGCRQLASQTDSHLEAIRARLLALLRDHRVIGEGHSAATRAASGLPAMTVIDSSLLPTFTSDLESLGLQSGVASGDDPEPPTGDGQPISEAVLTVEEALGELDSLK